MKNELLSGIDAVALGAGLVKADKIIVTDKIIANSIKKMKFRTDEYDFIETENDDVGKEAALACEACGKRSFFAGKITDTGNAVFMRLPVIFANIGYTEKQEGCLIFIPESNQEIIDMIIEAYKICENRKILLPGIIEIRHPFFRETVKIPSEASIDKFLPKLRLPYKLDIEKKVMFNPVIEDKNLYTEFMIQQQKAIENTEKVIKKVDETWNKKFHRRCSISEEFMVEDAEKVIIISGYNSVTAKACVTKLREQGVKAGLLRIRILGACNEGIFDCIANTKHVAIVDDFAMGYGRLFKELKMFSNKKCINFISGGKMISEKEFEEIFNIIEKTEKDERVWII